MGQGKTKEVYEVATNSDSNGINIASLIRVIRGQQVMLDFDLAALYGVENKRLNEQVKRNVSRFPSDFMFQLDKEEMHNLKSQIATSSWGGTRKRPYAFTRNGIGMLSSVLRSETAVGVRNTRHAVAAGLLTDLVGVIAAIAIAYLFFY